MLPSPGRLAAIGWSRSALMRLAVRRPRCGPLHPASGASGREPWGRATLARAVGKLGQRTALARRSHLAVRCLHAVVASNIMTADGQCLVTRSAMRSRPSKDDAETSISDTSWYSCGSYAKSLYDALIGHEMVNPDRNALKPIKQRCFKINISF